MAGPIHQADVFSIAEKERWNDPALDEEGIALSDLSRQRSQAGSASDQIAYNPNPNVSNAQRRGLRRTFRTSDGRSREETKHYNSAGRFYQKLLSLGFMVRWLVFTLPLAVVIAIPIILGALIPNLELGGVRIIWIFSWVEIVWISLWISKVFAKLLPLLFRFLVGVVSTGTAKYYTIIRALELPITLLSWMFVSFVTFTPMMTQNFTQKAKNDTAIKEWEYTLRQILAALTVTALIYLIQKTFIQFVAVNFHKRSYEERIRVNKAAAHILARLYERSRVLFPSFTSDFQYEDEMLVGYKNQRMTGINSGAVSPSARVILDNAKKSARRAVRRGVGIFGGNAAKEITGKQIFEPTSPYNVVIDALANSESCSSLARRIWYSVAEESKESLDLSDFEDVLGNRELAVEAMLLFDKDGNNDVTLEEADMVINEIGKERKALARSMKDVDSAIGKLDSLLVSVVFIIAIFIVVSFLNKSFVTTLATAGTTLLSLSFIFSVTCQEVLGSMIFLFHKHPFDVGDRVDINGYNYVVKELSLLFTVFKRTDGKIVQVNNATLNTLFIENVRRSTHISEVVQLSVDFGTTFTKIQLLRKEMQKFVQSNGRDFLPDLEIEILDAKGLDKLALQVVIKHKSNWQNDALRAQRRNKFMCALVAAVRKCEIAGAGPGIGEAANPMHYIIDSKTPPATSDHSPSFHSRYKGANGDDLSSPKAPKTSPPGTSHSEQEFITNTSLLGKNVVANDPATQLDEGWNSSHLNKSGFQYFGDQDAFDTKLPGNTTNTGRRMIRRSSSDDELLGEDKSINSMKSMGRRRREDIEHGDGGIEQ